MVRTTKKKKPGEENMQAELERESVKTVDQMLEKEDRTKSKPKEEKVLVEFYNIEEPGVPIKFSFGSTKRPEKHTLMHGGKYQLSRAVINHLESRQTPIYDFKPDGSGNMKKMLTGYKSRFQCRQVWE